MIPEIIATGERTVNGKKVTYDDVAEDSTQLRITTQIADGKEEFTNLISNRKPKTSEYRQAQKENTQLSARTTEAEVSDAKLENNSQTDKSERGPLTLRTSDGVHLAVLKKLPEIIGESIEAEVHPDYTKQNGKRNADNDVNSKSLVHRFYGAVNIEGNQYRVKTTM